MTKKIIEEGWEKYLAGLNPNAGEVQLYETKNAFYAGAYTLFRFLIAEPEDFDAKKEEEIMEELALEFEEFRKAAVRTRPKSHFH